MRFCMIKTSGIGFGGLHGKNRLSGGISIRNQASMKRFNESLLLGNTNF